MEDIQAKAEQLRLRLSSLNLNAVNLPRHQTLRPISEEEEEEDEVGMVCERNGVGVGLESMILVHNLPVVGRERVHKLETEIRELFSGVGMIKKDGFSIPINSDTQMTLGYCVIQYNTRQEAELAIENRDGCRFGESTLSVSLFDDSN